MHDSTGCSPDLLRPVARRAASGSMMPDQLTHSLGSKTSGLLRLLYRRLIAACVLIALAGQLSAQQPQLRYGEPAGELRIATGSDGMLDGSSPLRPQAAETVTPSIDANTALLRRGTVSFRSAPLAQVILVLSEEWGVNIVAGSDVSGEISGTFKNETLDKILNSLLTAAGYDYQKIGNSLVIMPRDASGGSTINFAVEVVELPAVEGNQLSELLEALKTQMSPEGKLLPVQSSGKLTIQDTVENIAAVKRLLKSLTGRPTRPVSKPAPVATTQPETIARPAIPVEPLGALELRPQYMPAFELEAPMEMLVGEGNLAIMDEENVMVVFGDETIQRKAKQLMARLDRPRRQVRITGYIYDVDLSEIEKLGVDFNQQMMTQAVDANGVPRNLALSQGGLLTPNPPSNAASIVSGLVDSAASATGSGGAAAAAATSGATGGQFMFRTLHNQFELQSLVQAIQDTKGSKLLADPHVTVVDRHTASLGIVTKIPIQQLTQTQQGGNIASTSFQEAGIKLEVTPRIAGDGTIELQVVPEFSTLTGFQNGNPVIDSRIASTVVRVAHGEAIVIGGLRSKTSIETVRGIPGLMDMRFFGKLFRMHDTNVRESELIVFIMPEIVDYTATGLERESHALDVVRASLSDVQTASRCPFCPNCKDEHCPNHYPTPKFHNGMHDVGIVGANEEGFTDSDYLRTMNPPAPEIAQTPERFPMASQIHLPPGLPPVISASHHQPLRAPTQRPAPTRRRPPVSMETQQRRWDR